MENEFSLEKYFNQIKRNSKNQIYDPVRKKWITSTPEEIVRQLFIVHLHSELHYSLSNMSVEKQLVFGGFKRRFDLVVYDPSGDPLVIVECKSYEIAISQRVLDQAANYNFILKAPYLAVTNGRSTLIAKIDHALKSYQFIEQLPFHT